MVLHHRLPPLSDTHDINFHFDGQSSADNMAGVQPYRLKTAGFCCKGLWLFVYVLN